METKEIYKLTKITDVVFNNNHPNNINEGYVKTGELWNGLPKIGMGFFIGTLITSTVISELDENGIFKTKNSIYKLEKI